VGRGCLALSRENVLFYILIQGLKESSMNGLTEKEAVHLTNKIRKEVRNKKRRGNHRRYNRKVQ